MIIPGVLASSQKGGFPPPPVAGYDLWLDGKDSTAFTFSSSNVVSSWLDKSGNAYNFSQATVANQPTRNVTSGLVTFDGSNDILASGSKFMDNMHNGGENTLFIVFQPTSTNGGFIMDDGANSSSDVGFGFYNYSSTDFGVFVARAVTGTTSINSRNNPRPANNVTGLLTIMMQSDAATAADRSFVYLNTGTASQTNAQTNSPSGAVSSYNPVLGSNAPSGGDYYNGAIGEIMWFDSYLSLANREAVRDWLIAKWGI